jgi:hypothetical protein
MRVKQEGMNMADASKKGGSNGSLTTMFIAAATAIITGIPTDFISA